jgi:hypothetical protein
VHVSEPNSKKFRLRRIFWDGDFVHVLETNSKKIRLRRIFRDVLYLLQAKFKKISPAAHFLG